MMTFDPNDDDKKLFRDVMRTVTPLKSNKKQQLTRSNKAPRPLRQHQQSISTTQSYHFSNHYPDVVGSETILSYQVDSLPQKRLSALRKGDIRFEARLDLHGLTTSEAQDRLCQFIDTEQHHGHRCVLIIHGKGSPTGDAPILKNCVNHWLKQLPSILAFHSALPKDGGSGALYALLKKNRIE